MNHPTTEPRPSGAPGSIRNYADLPGPPGLPWVGNSLQIEPETAHLQFEAWARRYGASFKVRLGPRRLLVTHDATVVNGVLRDRPEGFERPRRQGALLREMGFDEGLFFANDAVWKMQRRMVMSAFNPEHVRNYFPELLKVTARLQRRWEAAAEAEQALDLQGELMRFTVDAIAGLAFGADVNTLASDEDVIQQHLSRIFPALSRRTIAIIPYWRFFKFAKDRELDASAQAVKVAIDAFVAKTRAEMSADSRLAEKPKNLLQAMLAAAGSHDSTMTDHDVAGNVLIMLVAGEDTTANTLAWMIYLLRRNADALRAAREEVRSIVPRLDRFTPERLDALHYLEACIHETLRMKPVAPVLPVQAVRDVTVGNLAIPKGTFVVALTRPNGLSPEAVEDPHSFQPERWLATAGRPVPAKLSIPFGSGPRLCPGRYLATLEMKMAAAMLLGGFKIESVKAVQGDEPQELLGFAMGPSPIEMKLARLDTTQDLSWTCPPS